MLLLFIFDLHFCCCVFILLWYLHLLMFFSLLFDVIPHRSVDYRWGFYTPFYTFSPANCRLIRDTFILFNPFCSCREFTALSGHLLPTGVFYLILLHRHILSCVYQGCPGSWQFFLEVCRPSLQAFLMILQAQAKPICLFDSQ